MNKYVLLNLYVFDAFYKAFRSAEIKKMSARERKLRRLRLEYQRKMKLTKESV